MKKSHMVVFLLGLIGWQFVGSPVWRLDFSEVLVCLLLGVVCAFPIVRWASGEIAGLPFAEVYLALHLPYYLRGYLAGNMDFMEYSEGVRIQSGMVVIVFLLVLQAAYYAVAQTGHSSHHAASGLFAREIIGAKFLTVFWILLLVWLGYWAVLMLGWLPIPGAILQAVRAASNAIGAVAVFYLFLAMGRRQLSPTQGRVLTALFCTALLLQTLTGFLVGGVVLVANALVAYTLGRNRLPVIAAVLSFAVFTFLQAGKGEVRAHYWGEGKNYSEMRLNPVEFYEFWIGASVASITAEKAGGAARANILDRANLMQMLGLVVSQTPEHLPFMGGETYWAISAVVVPRIFWPEKPRGSHPTDLIALHYGVQTSESLEVTAIGFGHIAEAWANFGWIGVVGIAGFLGCLFGLLRRFTIGRATDTLGFVSAVVFFSQVTNLEVSLGQFLVNASYFLVVTTVMFLLLSRPPVHGPVERGTLRNSSLEPLRKGALD